MTRDTTRLRPWLGVILGLALISAAARFGRTAAGPTTKPAPAVADEGGGVCFGTLDLEHGVAALEPIQPGRVAEVLVSEGQEVKQGAALLRLEDEPARGRLAEAEAAVDLARLQVRQAVNQAELHRIRVAQQQAMRDAMRSRTAAARRLLAREERLSKSAVLIESQRSVHQENVREAEALERVEDRRLADLEARDVTAETRHAEAELRAAEARRDQARLALAECALKAPRPGTVLRILVGPGDVARAQPGRPAVLFVAEGPQVIRATVEQEFSRRVEEGEPALILDEADPGATWRGRVGSVAGWCSQRRTILHDPSQMSDVRTVVCVIVLKPGQPRLRLGQGVRVLIGPSPP